MKQDERRFRSTVAMSEVDMKIETEEVGTKQPSTSSSGKGRPSHRRSWPSLGDPEQRSKVIKISHIPYGFFEQELLKYFRQFGRVRRVRVARSPKASFLHCITFIALSVKFRHLLLVPTFSTGNFKGWAFVSFTDVDVAQVAAETMHGYLMFEKRLICECAFFALFTPLRKPFAFVQISFNGHLTRQLHPQIFLAGKVLKNKEVPNCMRSGKCLKRPPLRGARAKKHARLAGKHKSEFRDAANQVEKEEPKEEVYEDVGENTSKGSEPTVEAAELPSAKKKKKKKKHAASRKDTKTVIE
ncbi:unnamed protein product [Toxocara canis]|uniref:RRM domain-containing protein n=1 Tax=Toxocara canis TaxID=6265 RepID=A0A183V8H3_TOXCA|nr:unnamed protein product [Toxocara canis]